MFPGLFPEIACVYSNSIAELPLLPATLRKLYLTKNQISAMPDEWRDMSLEEVKLDDNQLVEIPHWFGEPGPLTDSLLELDLEHNRLSDLPPKFCSAKVFPSKLTPPPRSCWYRPVICTKRG